MVDPNLEWLETNGAGGFACAAFTGELRRFWHGLLWASRRPPVDRVRVVAGVQEAGCLQGKRLRYLSSSWQGGKWRKPEHRGHRGADPMWFAPWYRDHPVMSWSFGLQGHLRRVVAMPRFEQRTLLRYDLSDATQVPLRLRLQFLLPVGGPKADIVFSQVPDMVERTSSVATITCEAERDCEDHWTEEMLFTEVREFTLQPRGVFWVDMVAEGTARRLTAEEALDEEQTRRAALRVPAIEHRDPGLSQRLAHAADQFIVRRQDGNMTLLAGYPWFTDWGRDTMISLPGLCLRTGRFEEAKSMLGHFLAHVDGGIIPNLFPEAGETPHYNTVDATLWMFETIARYVRASGDAGFVTTHYHALRGIIDCHVRGTHNEIRVDTDGLLRAGGPGTQLTWMDVKVNDEVPTPRHGKAVEIQGLWYNALLLMAGFAEERGHVGDAATWRGMAEVCRAAFRQRFAPLGDGGLPDVVDRDGPGTMDARCRPNQVIPFGLSHNIIPEGWRKQVLVRVQKVLLVPQGLRTLAPGEAEYHGIYRGDRLARDRAYHQGTVWPWLLGPFVDGVEQLREELPRLHGSFMTPTSTRCRRMLHHFDHAGCVQSVSEILDADEPHVPRGCFAQGWSVAALIEWMCLIP